LGSVQVSLTLPFFGARRQDPAIASKFEARGRIEAERDAWRRERIREFESDLAERDALARQLDRARRDALPLAGERVDLQTAAFGAGRAPLSAVLSARRDLAEARLRIVELEGRLAAVGARLHFTFDARQP
jgi:outer membrane protein, heavy metal efflux system